MAVLVLGGGWVGSAVARAARRHGDVTVLDPPLDERLAARDDAARRVLRDEIDRGATDVVVNACGRVAGTLDELRDANVAFLEWLCDALDGTGVRLVHVGSASEYGDPGGDGRVTPDGPTRPRGDYAGTKAAGTEVVRTARQGGLDATVARVFNIVGPGLAPTSPVAQWLAELRELPAGGGEVEVWWPATTRDFVHLDDVADALVDIGRATGRPEVVDVCTGTGISFGGIVEALARALDVDATVRSLDRPGIPVVVGDPAPLRTLIGWAPTMDPDTLAGAVTGRTGAPDRVRAASR